MCFPTAVQVGERCELKLPPPWEKCCELTTASLFSELRPVAEVLTACCVMCPFALSACFARAVSLAALARVRGARSSNAETICILESNLRDFGLPREGYIGESGCGLSQAATKRATPESALRALTSLFGWLCRPATSIV